MISKVFNNGWGDQNPILDYQEELIRDLEADVLIHSTWYTDDFHEEVVAWLDENPIRTMVILSFFDAHIARRDLFKDRNIEIREIGYYNGPHFFDFWARFTRDHMALPSDRELLDYQLINRPFLSYNRKPHPHRIELWDQLVANGLTDKGIVTMDNLKQLDEDVEVMHWAPSGGSMITNDIASLGRTDVWCSSFLNIVTETWPDINRAYFVSEKIYKPIVGLRPFFVYAEDLGSKWLHDREFQTFEKDFLDIYPDTITKGNLVDFLNTLSQQPTSYLHQKYVALQDKILYNRDRFNQYVAEMKIK
jgi:hypothetical protein